MAKDKNPKIEAKDVKPEADLDGNVSLGEKPADPKPDVDPAEAAQQLKGAISDKTLKVTPIAESVDGKDAGAAQSNHTLMMTPAGALLPSAVDDRSRNRELRTPDRPGSIYDRNSFSRKIKYMNVGCEQAKAQIYHAPTIKEEPLQGAFDTQIPFQSYSNKRRGEAPQSQLHFRSIDFEHVASEVVYGVGQLIDYRERRQDTPTGTVRRIHCDQDYPTISRCLVNKVVTEQPCGLANTRGNYLLLGMDITFARDANGNETLQGIHFNQDRIPVVGSNNSSARWNYNLETETNIESQRVLKLADSDIIKPDKPNTNEFAMALGGERKQFFNLYADMEADTGAVVAMAYRFANMEYGTIHTRLGKSGSQTSNEDLVKYFISNSLEFRNGLHTNNLNGLQIYRDVFANNYNDGTLPMIPVYRYCNKSIRQFSDWSTLLTNNSTPKTLIDEATPILDSFFVKPEFINYLKNTQLYSYSSDEYNPNTPNVITPGYKIILREDLNVWANAFDRSLKSDVNLSATGLVYGQAWCQGDNKNYEVRVKHPLVDGLYYFLLEKETEFLIAHGGIDGMRRAQGLPEVQGATQVTLHYNFDFTTEAFNPACFWILAAVKYMARIRNNNTYRIPDMWKEIGNPAEDHCVGLSSGLALASANFTINGYNSVEMHKMSDIGRFRYLYPERFNILDSTNVKNTRGDNKVLLSRWIELPWYFAEKSIDVENISNGLFNNDEQLYAMNYPVQRRGLTHDDVSFFKKFTPRETRLLLDALVEVPHPHYNGLGSIANEDVTHYNPVSMVAIRHDEYSSGRVALEYRTNNTHNSLDLDDNNTVTITFGQVLQTPRELGIFASYMPNLHTIVDGANGVTVVDHVITFADTIATPVDDFAERLEAVENAMGIEWIDDGARVLSMFNAPMGAGILGESLDIYWNQYPAEDYEALQESAGYLQIYDRVYDLYTYVNWNQVVLHNHDLCLGLGYNMAPTDNMLHNEIHDIYLPGGIDVASAVDFYYDRQHHDYGVLPHLALSTPSASKCIFTMIAVVFKPYNYTCGYEVPRAIAFGNLSTAVDTVQHSPSAENQTDLFEQAYYFNFVGFDATIYVEDINARSKSVNELKDGYLKDIFVENSQLLQ